jgi:hypothetical protein
MATYVQERRTRERRHDFYPAVLRGIEGLRVSWGGVWGGVLVAMGLFLLLTALGVAIGRSLESAGTGAEGMGLTAALWAAGSLLASLFLGGLVSTRVGGVYDRTTGFFEGALVWVVSVLLMFLFATTGISTIASGMFGMMAAPAPQVGAVPQRFDDLASGNVSEMLTRLNDPRTSQRVAGATGIPESEVHLILSEIEQRVEAAAPDTDRARAEARRGVAELYAEARVGARQGMAAVDPSPASRNAWATFAALILSLGAAIAGAMMGRREALPVTARRPPS